MSKVVVKLLLLRRRDSIFFCRLLQPKRSLVVVIAAFCLHLLLSPSLCTGFSIIVVCTHFDHFADICVLLSKLGHNTDRPPQKQPRKLFPSQLLSCPPAGIPSPNAGFPNMVTASKKARFVPAAFL